VSARNWDAATYDRVSNPQVAFAQALIERLGLRGDERVLDAGCGSGRVTELVLERLPRGELVACDASAEMVAAARGRLAGRAQVIEADLTELALEEPVDVVFSNAVFHWISDHDALFARLHAALRPGGRLVAQCGGAGNIERFHVAANEVAGREPYAAHFNGWIRPWNFASPQATADRLVRAGFSAVESWLEPFPVRPDEPYAYLRTVCLGPFLERMPADLHGRFVREVAAACGDPLELDYVRLNIVARRPA
jgi:trans-aconitate 2-methyltransferase